MEEYMQKSLTNKILKEAANRYDFDISMLEKIGGFENFVYEFIKDDKPYILRFVHSGHRTYDLVLAEIEFIDYLNHNGASVSTVVHSINDLITEKIQIDDLHYFSVSVFTKAPGTFVKPEEKTAELFQQLGAEIGRLHRLTKAFNPAHKRMHWYDENFSEIGKRVLSKEDQHILDIYDEVEKNILSLPTTKDLYGLIHTDLHFGNMYYDGKQLTFFDFDDSAYKHFISDIAIVIYYDSLYVSRTKEEYNERARFVLHNLMAGYQKENQFDPSFFQYLNEFLLLRSVILYIVLVAAGLSRSDNPRHIEFMKQQKQRVTKRLMDVDLEFVLDGL